MNQSIEEPQDCMKQNKNIRLLKRKRWAVLSVVIALMALLLVPVLAWLYMQRSMETITKVNMPYALRIGAGDTQPIQELELSNIDVSGEQKSKDIVFCVYSAQEGKTYHLQLAHTTNIGFMYEIYKATISSEGDINYLDKQYKRGDLLAGKYLNKESNSSYATKTYHNTTYGDYDNVQSAAEPLYWKTDNEEKLPTEKNDNDYYVNYYILHISWDDAVQNNKETDMVYLMAG